MKKILITFFLFIVLFFPPAVFGHMVGQPPFFKINGEYSDLYPVPISSASNFELPQDLAKQNHFVGEKLEMEMDINQLPILPEVIDQTTFLWEFGDGARAEGLKNSHTYSKPGSYVMHIMAKYRNDEPQLIQSTLINILPDQNYLLPQSKIKVNDKESSDPLTDIITVDFSKPVQFDASLSTSNQKIVEYFWDFGDGDTSNEANPSHQYDSESIQMFPVLRVKDSNGFIHDSYVQLDSIESISSLTTEDRTSFIWISIIVLVIFVSGFVGWWYFKRKNG